MFLGAKTWYTASGQNSRGPFLVVICRGGELRAFIRTVHFRQLGNFMMGTVRLCGHEFVLSGPLGGDGLPAQLERCRDITKDGFIDTPKYIKNHIWNNATPIPDELANKYWKSETYYMLKEWAIENKTQLKKRFSRLKEESE